MSDAPSPWSQNIVDLLHWRTAAGWPAPAAPTQCPGKQATRQPGSSAPRATRSRSVQSLADDALRLQCANHAQPHRGRGNSACGLYRTRTDQPLIHAQRRPYGTLHDAIWPSTPYVERKASAPWPRHCRGAMRSQKRSAVPSRSRTHRIPEGAGLHIWSIRATFDKSMTRDRPAAAPHDRRSPSGTAISLPRAIAATLVADAPQSCSAFHPIGKRERSARNVPSACQMVWSSRQQAQASPLSDDGDRMLWVWRLPGPLAPASARKVLILTRPLEIRSSSRAA